MSAAGSEPSGGAQNLVPRLTEVVESWESQRLSVDGSLSGSELMTGSFHKRGDASVSSSVAGQTAAGELIAPEHPTQSGAHVLNEDQIVEKVLLDLQRQIDLMLEYRVREALIPVLTRVSDALVLEARNELASTLRAIVSKSVAQELARHRKP